jgi:SAM-dependent MidA family methyltransferase
MRTTADRSQLPEPHPDALALSNELLTRIRRAIRANNEWLSFAQFQTHCLYEPGLGYYSGPTFKFGSQGDFTTAPEICVLFGQTLALEIERVLTVTGGDVIELGAGSGKLAVDIIGQLLETDFLTQSHARYRILELSADLQARQREAIEKAHPQFLSRVEWLSELPETITGCVVANEVLDAVPVQLVRKAGDRWLERGVTLDASGQLTFADRAVTDHALQHAVDRRLQTRSLTTEYVTEIGLAAEALAATVAAKLQNGIAIWIDYGFSANEFYHPQRSTGTLMCHYRHFAHPDPFYLPGLQDITTHVDFSSIADASVEAGAQVECFATQANYLLAAGITRLMEEPIAQGMLQPGSAEFMRLVSGLQRLTSPSEMGELFKVLVVSKGKGTGLGAAADARQLAL